MATASRGQRTDVATLHRLMVRIRQFEERTADLLDSGEIKCPTHLYTGQEAVAVGVCASLRKDDYVLGNHRSHGHYLAKGGDTNALMAELFCRIDGCAKGRGGSMHIIDLEHGLLGTVPMVAATIPLAVGAALASSIRGEDRVAVAFFGDSATEEGVFHESVNFAVLHRLPIVFVCENNGFSSHLRLNRRRTFEDISRLVEGFDIPTPRIDGNDVLAVKKAADAAVRRARSGKGPSFIECVTYRWRGHVGPSYDLGIGIREKAEVDAWKRKDPIRRLERRMKGKSGVGAKDLAKVWAEETALVDESVAFARASPPPLPGSVLEAVFKER